MRSPYEIKAHKYLEAEGYQVDYKIRPRIVPRKYNVDFFARFDLIAYKEGEPLRWISIKGHAGAPTAHQKAIKDFKMPEGNQKEIWVYRKSKNIIKKIIDN